jgi:hypothetical protein
LTYNFEWDPDKAGSNVKKHRVDFERAAEIFLDPMMLSIYDDAHSESEDRWVTLGQDRNNVTLAVVPTFRQIGQSSASIRIISARRATKKERRQYQAR